ncbi:MAG: hypothetical protein ACOY90_03095 [Candidatus Zhuqueibacterota bacterium]
MRHSDLLRIPWLVWTLLMFACSPPVRHFSLNDFCSPQCIKDNREKFERDLISDTIHPNLSLPLNAENEPQWESAFWAMELMLYRSDSLKERLRMGLADFENRSDSFRRAILEAAYCLYPADFSAEMEAIARQTRHPKLFAMAALYVTRNAPARTSEFERLLKTQFPDQLDHPIISRLQRSLAATAPDNVAERPPLSELLRHSFVVGKPVIFSMQRQNRDYPGLVIIKKADGAFVRNADGAIFHVSQLARSISNLPGYITNGSTPQGVFSIQGIGQSDNDFIGPSPNIQLVMPWEAPVSQYFHGNAGLGSAWSRDIYQGLLPDSWKEYAPIYEAFDAGAAGRTEIIAHGTTINPEFYRGLPWFPNTPSLGCLTALEFWSAETGRTIYSDQIALVSAFLSAGSETGFLVVVEIDAQNRPVAIEDVIVDVLQPEHAHPVY